LKDPEVYLTGIQARAVARGFAHYAQHSGIVIWGCSILPQHVHMVIARHAFNVEHIVNQLKGHATRRLMTENLHPESKCWSRGLWKVFLNTPEDLNRAIHYVENNPLRENLPRQRWNMVRPFPMV
jgi:REP element-mobilizing transposase RayT